MPGKKLRQGELFAPKQVAGGMTTKHRLAIWKSQHKVWTHDSKLSRAETTGPDAPKRWLALLWDLEEIKASDRWEDVSSDIADADEDVARTEYICRLEDWLERVGHLVYGDTERDVCEGLARALKLPMP